MHNNNKYKMLIITILLAPIVQDSVKMTYYDNDLIKMI